MKKRIQVIEFLFKWNRERTWQLLEIESRILKIKSLSELIKDNTDQYQDNYGNRETQFQALV